MRVPVDGKLYRVTARPGCGGEMINRGGHAAAADINGAVVRLRPASETAPGPHVYPAVLDRYYANDPAGSWGTHMWLREDEFEELTDV